MDHKPFTEEDKKKLFQNFANGKALITRVEKCENPECGAETEMMITLGCGKKLCFDCYEKQYIIPREIEAEDG